MELHERTICNGDDADQDGSEGDEDRTDAPSKSVSETFDSLEASEDAFRECLPESHDEGSEKVAEKVGGTVRRSDEELY